MSDLETRIARQLAAELDGLRGPEPAWTDAAPTSLVQARSGRPRVLARIPLGLVATLAVVVSALGLVAIRGADVAQPVASPAASAAASLGPVASADETADARPSQSPQVTDVPSIPPRPVAGTTWNGLPAFQVFRAVGLLSPTVGWVATDVDLRFTDDGGKTWRIANPPGRFVDSIYWAFSFEASGRGLAIGCPQKCEHLVSWRTANLGRTWVASEALVAVPGMSEGSLLLQPLSGDHLALQVSDDFGTPPTVVLYVSPDGGTSWTGPRRIPGWLPQGVNGLSPIAEDSAGLIATEFRRGQLPRLSVSGDEGSSWVSASLDPPASVPGATGELVSFVAGRMFDTRRGVVAVTWMGSGSTPTFYETFDGGATWTTLPARPGGDVGGSVRLEGPSTWWMITSPEVAQDAAHQTAFSSLTSDGGATWTTTPMAQLGWVEGPGAFADDQTAWVVFKALCKECIGPPEQGKSYQILGTTDGGATWYAVTPTR